MEESEDLYALLGLPGGVDGAAIATAELKKAWRRRCLEWHPDKRPGDATAAAQFNRINNAFEVLSDANARKAYDELQLVHKRRQDQRRDMSVKRQKMVDELQKREAAFDAQRREKAAEMSAAQRLREEIARIREKNSRKINAAAGAAAAAAKPVDVFVSEDDKDKSLKVTWDLGGSPAYNSQSLREIFEKFGPVEDVLILQKKKGVALVVMETTKSAFAATQTQCGHLSNPLLVIPLGNPSRPEPAEKNQSPDTKHPPPAQPATTKNHTTLAGSGFGDREDQILNKLKAAQERKRKMAAAAAAAGAKPG